MFVNKGINLYHTPATTYLTFPLPPQELEEWRMSDNGDDGDRSLYLIPDVCIMRNKWNTKRYKHFGEKTLYWMTNMKYDSFWTPRVWN